MGRKSSIKTLPKEVQAAVVSALEAGATIDGIVEKLADLGHPRSRSAVGRYAKDYAGLAERHRDIRVVAESFAKDFGSAQNAEGKLMVQLLTSIGARMVLPLAAGDGEDLDPKAFHFLAKATKELQSAAKIDADRDARVREEGRKQAEAEMRRKLDDAGGKGELDPDALKRARRILGFAD
ncbi:phage protein Gp27 family protein [Novosphingobium sp. EMRT-2]|uniref:phage protein Gp27 family protein n=1 Tax=Novosphingobium sp. EMRT-2 TaxID=2571749 RepID=UPI0010BD36E0|nr:phage protein Gp27 family protein [Novosphingobium sp. EMRT-2]QCI93240.1 DUF3486 family protein [Novosphingobium sp. EMRT-2]